MLCSQDFFNVSEVLILSSTYKMHRNEITGYHAWSKSYSEIATVTKIDSPKRSTDFLFYRQEFIIWGWNTENIELPHRDSLNFTPYHQLLRLKEYLRSSRMDVRAERLGRNALKWSLTTQQRLCLLAQDLLESSQPNNNIGKVKDFLPTP